MGLGFAHGAWLAAPRLNPLVASGLIRGGLWLGVRLVSGRSLRLEMSPVEHRVALILSLGVLFANWAWVLRVQG